MNQRAAKMSTVALVLSVILLLISNVGPVFGVSLVRPKSETIANFKNLCDAHRDIASYESLGKSLLGQDIWIFRFGNPNGGRILWDAQTHGGEDLGTEAAWIFVNWLLNSGDAQARTYLQNNYLVIVPVINIDTIARGNMRRQYTLSNGTILSVPYGVNLNRNFPAGWGTYGTSNPLSSDYRGFYGGSEPETNVMINAFRRYKPAVHVNTHMWGGTWASFDGEAGIINTIKQSQTDYFNTVQPSYNGTLITPYSISSSRLAGATVPRQSHDMGLGSTSGVIELNPSSDQFQQSYNSVPLWAIQQYYYPKMLGFLYGTLDSVQQNPMLGSLDYDASLNEKPITQSITYSITYPDGSVKTFYRTGSVLYNLAPGAYSIEASLNGELQQSDFSVTRGRQTRVVLRFGAASSFYYDFESGSLNEWVVRRSYDERIMLSTEQAKSGTHSVKFSVDNMENASESAYIEKQLTPMGEAYLQAYVRFSSLPTSGSWCPINIRAQLSTPGALTWLELRRQDADAVWAVSWRDSAAEKTRTAAISEATVNANRWYQVEAYVKVDTPTTGEVKWWIDGNLVLEQMGIDNSEWQTGVQYIQLGERYSSPLSGGHSVYVDAVQVSGNNIPVSSDDFEDGLNGWRISRSFNDVVTWSTEQSVFGTHSVKSYVDNFENAGEMAYFYQQIAPMREVYVKAYVRFSRLPLSGDWCPINIRARLETPGALAWLELHREGTGVFWTSNWRDSAAAATRSATIPEVAVNANQWYCIEIYVKVDTPTTGEVKFWIDGNLVVQQTGIDNTEWQTGVQYIQLGERYSSPVSGAHTVYVDAVQISSNYIP